MNVDLSNSGEYSASTYLVKLAAAKEMHEELLLVFRGLVEELSDIATRNQIPLRERKRKIYSILERGKEALELAKIQDEALVT